MARLFAFAILLLLQLAFASQVPLDRFLNISFEPGQNIEVKPSSNPTFALVLSDGVETYLVNVEAGKPVYDPAQITSILEYDAKASTGFEAKVDSALAFPADVAAAKQAAEAKCMQYTGTDMHPCTDKHTCTLACFAVPLCSTPLYSDGFWEAILDWTNGRQNFSALLASYSGGLEAVETSPSAVDQKIAMLDSLSAQEKNLSKNPLFLNRTDEGCAGGGSARCFEFCPKIDYSQARIASQKQNLQSLKAAVAQVSAQAARAAAIVAAGRENDGYLVSRGRDYQDFRLDMVNAISRLGAQSDALSKNVTDREIAPLLNSLSNLSLSINAQADAGNYRSALSKRPEFEAKQNELSGRIDSDAKAYASLLLSLEKLKQTVDKSEKIIGSQSAGYYREDLAAVGATLSSAPDFEKIGAAKLRLDSIKGVLTAEIAAKAVGGVLPEEGPGQNASSGNQPGAPAQPQLPKLPASFPCLPALALLLVAGAAFRGKN